MTIRNRKDAIEVLKSFVIESATASVENFAAIRGHGPGQRRIWERATNTYQTDLGTYYEKWTADLSRQLGGADPQDYDALIAAALLALSTYMKQTGSRSLLDGVQLGMGNAVPSPKVLNDVANMVQANSDYVDRSLTPDINYRLRMGLNDPLVIATGAAAIAGVLMPVQARLESYAGAMWTAIQRGAGEAAIQAAADPNASDTAGRVSWNLDEQAQHCQDCLDFAGEYDSWDEMMARTSGRLPGEVQCSANCRCSLEVDQGNGTMARP